MLGLYAHVPFCSAICNYCNFNRGLFDEALKARFVEAMLEEVRAAARETGHGPAADTLYFGGGTPSLLTSSDIASIVNESRRSFGLTDDAEITLEANPETLDARALEGFRHAGVNRLSIGVQSFRDDELKRLGRLHSAERARQAVRLAHAAGFDNVSIDLMMWLPGQDVCQWLASVEDAVQTAPEHLSLYILEVYPHLPLKQEIGRQGWTQLGDDGAAEMYETAMSLLDAAGYTQYEISNVCRPRLESRHNLKYWTDGEWWGFGPGAHSTCRGQRWRNVSSTEDYVRRIGAGATVIVDRRQLSDEERLGDALFTGLRLNHGIDLEILSTRYGIDVWERFGGRLAPYCEAGILIREEGRLRLTRQGMLLANDVMSVFV
ncbi:MAG TPA: radical SAM family heme chaperone HemW [Vicinamibacterales bacterium]|nr:radical SAM family heme chaperone HemW [Vicinamibacterales bacterium]